MELDEVLDSLKSGKISVTKAKDLLSLYSIDKIENIAQIDVGRKNRRGIPEVIYAEKKKFADIKKIVQQVLKKSNSILVSRLNKKDGVKIKLYAKKLNLKIDAGKKSSSILLYKKTDKEFWWQSRNSKCGFLRHWCC